MEPRLKTSKKWTALPKELLTQIRTAFKSTFKDQLGGAKVEADGRIYPEEILLSVGFKTEGTLKQSNFLISIAYKKGKDDVLKLLNLATDAAGALFEQLFQSDDDQDFPRIYQEVNFEGRPIYVQYTTNNSELDKAANKLLGVADDESLAGGEWEDVEEGVTPDEIKAKLGISPEDMEELEEDEPDDDDDGEEDGRRNH
jgi:hypothetical protein